MKSYPKVLQKQFTKGWIWYKINPSATAKENIMAIWALTPRQKKSIVERQTWVGPEGQTVLLDILWRWGEFTLNQGKKPLTKKQCDENDVFDLSEWELQETVDGVSVDLDFGELDIDEDEEERLTAILSNGDAQDEGWECDTIDFFVEGPLDLQKL